MAAQDTLPCVTKQPQTDPDWGTFCKTGVQVTRGRERPRNLPDGRNPGDTTRLESEHIHIHRNKEGHSSRAVSRGRDKPNVTQPQGGLSLSLKRKS